MYAKIIVGMNTPEVDRVFDYCLPDELAVMAKAGVRVIVPFGRRNVKTEGYILSLSEASDVPKEKLKQVLEVLDEGKPVFTASLLQLAEWMKGRYFCTLNQCLQTIMPAGIRTKSRWLVRRLKMEGMDSLNGREKAVMEFLDEQQGETTAAEIEKTFGEGYRNLLQSLEEKGFLTLRQSLSHGVFQKEKKTYTLLLSEEMTALMERAKKDKRLAGQKKAIEALLEKNHCSMEEMLAEGVTPSALRTLVTKGIVQEVRTKEKRDVLNPWDYSPDKTFLPNEEQAHALRELAKEMEQENKRPVLLHGVTGSGKTEIYMQLIQKVLEKKQQAIVLVPEIALTPQITERFFARFGNAVSVTHSRLSQGERLDQWRKARDGDISVIIGPRSALFMPFENIGVIILDEMHENSYLSDVTPKYDARDVAKKLAKDCGALLIFGSATPDIAAYYKAITGEYRLLECKERVGGSKMPNMQIVDMRQELAEGNRSAFSRLLQEAVAENLQKGEQTMLFLNRRGYSTFVSCRSCGHVMKCPSCNMAYTYHAKENTLLCHYCGKAEENPKLCPACGSKYIRHFGTGTQKIEEEAKVLFPQATVLRMDLDTTTTKNSHQRILEQFAKGRADILIGTQLIAKGHDFPNVTLVGIMAADLSLNLGNYNGTETTYQLITQAGGRAGRGEKVGRVFIQTYQPEHYAIRHAAEQAYRQFYEEESIWREAMGYPPFGVFFSVVVSAQEEGAAEEAAEKLARWMEESNAEGRFSIMGPGPAFLSKFRGEYRQRIMVRGEEEAALTAFVLQGVEKVKKEGKRGIRFNLTLSPQNIV